MENRRGHRKACQRNLHRGKLGLRVSERTLTYPSPQPRVCGVWEVLRGGQQCVVELARPRRVRPVGGVQKLLHPRYLPQRSIQLGSVPLLCCCALHDISKNSRNTSRERRMGEERAYGYKCKPRDLLIYDGAIFCATKGGSYTAARARISVFCATTGIFQQKRTQERPKIKQNNPCVSTACIVFDFSASPQRTHLTTVRSNPPTRAPSES